MFYNSKRLCSLQDRCCEARVHITKTYLELFAQRFTVMLNQSSYYGAIIAECAEYLFGKERERGQTTQNCFEVQEI